MKLEQIQEYVVPTIALAVGLGIALACGLMIGQGDSKWALMIVGGLLVMGFLLAVQKRIWILILVTSMFGGKITALPVPFTVANLGVLIAFGMYLILKALKVVRLKPKIGIVEISMMVMLAYLATVYVRNPVGVEAFDSDRVGGASVCRYYHRVRGFLGAFALGSQRPGILHHPLFAGRRQCVPGVRQLRGLSLPLYDRAAIWPVLRHCRGGES
ncbi:MAG: hypothetical protein WDN28_31680 [Chthoniobacter sp.]